MSVIILGAGVPKTVHLESLQQPLEEPVLLTSWFRFLASWIIKEQNHFESPSLWCFVTTVLGNRFLAQVFCLHQVEIKSPSSRFKSNLLCRHSYSHSSTLWSRADTHWVSQTRQPASLHPGTPFTGPAGQRSRLGRDLNPQTNTIRRGHLHTPWHLQRRG